MALELELIQIRLLVLHPKHSVVVYQGFGINGYGFL
jgi:hypothetical protein